MKTKNKIALIICGCILIYIAVVILMAYFIFFGPTPKSVKNKMVKYYSDCEYKTLYGKLEDCQGEFITITLDEELILSLSEEETNSFIGNGLILPTVTYYLPGCGDALRKYGFYELLDEDGKPFTEETISIVVNNLIWWDGGIPFAVGVGVGENIYLDVETGKAKLIDYIQNDMY